VTITVAVQTIESSIRGISDVSRGLLHCWPLVQTKVAKDRNTNLRRGQSPCNYYCLRINARYWSSSLSKHRRSAGKSLNALNPAPKSTGNCSRRVSARPGPGRPTAARVEAITRAILVEARNEFRNSSYEAARMDAIAAAAGISKATLYGRYPTKEALLRAVIAERVSAWSQDWEPDSGSIPADLRQRLKQRGHRLMEYYCSGKLELLERLISSGPSMDELRRTRYEVGHKRTIQVIAQDIIDATGNRLIPSRAAIRLAEMFMAKLYGWWRMHQEVRRVTREEALAYADDAVDVLLDGLATWAAARSGP
jgi:TetR/AcrR family transcriptional repressor of mexJK operon